MKVSLHLKSIAAGGGEQRWSSSQDATVEPWQGGRYSTEENAILKRSVRNCPAAFGLELVGLRFYLFEG